MKKGGLMFECSNVLMFECLNESLEGLGGLGGLESLEFGGKRE